MAALKVFVVMCVMIATALAQRPFYAGIRPIGYPEQEPGAIDSLANRFGNDDPLPVQAYGDRGFVNRVNSLPIDQRPFWFINQKAYDDLRKNPQTYPERPNSFRE